MATIKDVASRAGVSISTVSHVLNHTRRVSEDATQKVLEAVAELNYAPNSVARSLKINSTKTIGMLVTNLPGAGMFHEILFAGGHVHWELFGGQPRRAAYDGPVAGLNAGLPGVGARKQRGLPSNTACVSSSDLAPPSS